MSKLLIACLALAALSVCVESKFYPKNFDVRFNWLNCTYSIYNEGLCVGNWAITLADVLSDRSCIKGTKVQTYSAQHFLDCYNSSYFSCAEFADPARVTGALEWLKTNPVTDSTCYPYDSYISGTPNTCRTACKDTTPFKNQYAIQGWEQLNTNENIKDSLLNDGSVLVVFKVYEDFIGYSTGLYVRNNNEYVQMHALKLIGWGTKKDDSNTQYWIMQNTWGTNWGANGLIEIPMDSQDIAAFYAINL